MRRATVTCTVEVTVDLYDAEEYDDEGDERRDVWRQANTSLGSRLLAVTGYTVESSNAGREDGEPDVRPAQRLP